MSDEEVMEGDSQRFFRELIYDPHRRESRDGGTASGMRSRSRSPHEKTQDTQQTETSSQDNLSSQDISDPMTDSAAETGNESASIYNAQSRGPYRIFIEKIIDEHPIPDIIELGRLLCLNQILFDVLTPSGPGKFEITFKSYEQPSQFLGNVKAKILLESKNLKAFMPLYLHISNGTVRNIPIGTTDKELFAHSSCRNKTKIISCKRLLGNARSETDGYKKPSLEPTTTILYTFNSEKIPDYIHIFQIPYRVHKYIPSIKFCIKCQRYGHSEKLCRSAPRCKHCGSFAHATAPECPNAHDPPKCLNCAENHLTSDKNCIEYKKQLLIRDFAQKDDISMPAAFLKYRNRIESLTPTDSRQPQTRPSTNPTSYAAALAIHPNREIPSCQPQGSNNNDEIITMKQYQSDISSIAESMNTLKVIGQCLLAALVNPSASNSDLAGQITSIINAIRPVAPQPSAISQTPPHHE